jgi:hypothetical protein
MRVWRALRRGIGSVLDLAGSATYALARCSLPRRRASDWDAVRADLVAGVTEIRAGKAVPASVIEADLTARRARRDPPMP